MKISYSTQIPWELMNRFDWLLFLRIKGSLKTVTQSLVKQSRHRLNGSTNAQTEKEQQLVAGTLKKHLEIVKNGRVVLCIKIFVGSSFNKTHQNCIQLILEEK